MSTRQCWRVNAPDVISETIDGETIILHLGNGFYFSAGGCGPAAWSLLSCSATVDDTAAALRQLYQTDGVDLEGELDRFIEELTSEGLLVPSDTPRSPTPEPAGAGPMPFVPPTLSKFTDMEDLLLLDPVHEVSPKQGWPYA
ncbi:PqqD family protein [Intrasporangium chromatireducens]|nr:PqqD family protein [Intrasporangium chromatireducens]